jgi:hypothetical protein
VNLTESVSVDVAVVQVETPASGARGTKGTRSPFYVAKTERPLDLTPWPSRRRSDYITGLLMVNSFIGLVMMYGREQPLILFFGGAAMVAWTLGLTWIVWVVMDRY